MRGCEQVEKWGPLRRTMRAAHPLTTLHHTKLHLHNTPHKATAQRSTANHISSHFQNINHRNPITAASVPVPFEDHFAVDAIQRYVNVTPPEAFHAQCPAGLDAVFCCHAKGNIPISHYADGFLCNSFATRYLGVSCASVHCPALLQSSTPCPHPPFRRTSPRMA